MLFSSAACSLCLSLKCLEALWPDFFLIINIIIIIIDFIITIKILYSVPKWISRSYPFGIANFHY